MTKIIFHSPVGPLTITTADDGALTEIRFEGVRASRLHLGGRDVRRSSVERQLEEYFAGKRTTFDLPLAPKGTEFQLAVWNELLNIPYGATITYSELARRIGRPAAVRAVGAANGANPIPIIIPCHRVIGANGTLTGYGGGIEIKRALLDLEGRQRLLPPLR